MAGHRLGALEGGVTPPPSNASLPRAIGSPPGGLTPVWVCPSLSWAFYCHLGGGGLSWLVA